MIDFVDLRQGSLRGLSLFGDWWDCEGLTMYPKDKALNVFSAWYLTSEDCCCWRRQQNPVCIPVCMHKLACERSRSRCDQENTRIYITARSRRMRSSNTKRLTPQQQDKSTQCSTPKMTPHHPLQSRHEEVLRAAVMHDQIVRSKSTAAILFRVQGVSRGKKDSDSTLNPDPHN